MLHRMLEVLYMSQPAMSRLFVFMFLFGGLVASVNIIASALSLYSKKRIPSVLCLSNASEFARAALSRRCPYNDNLAQPLDRSPGEHTMRGEALESARISFEQLVSETAAQVMFVRRISKLILLLSLLHFSLAAIPTYEWNCNDANIPGISCLYLALQGLFATTSLALEICTLIYLATALLERTLSFRKAEWSRHFASSRLLFGERHDKLLEPE